MVYIDQLFDEFNYNFQTYKSVVDKYKVTDIRNLEFLSQSSNEIKLLKREKILKNLSTNKLNNLNVLLVKLQERLEILVKKMKLLNTTTAEDNKDNHFSFSMIESYIQKLETIKFELNLLFELKRLIERVNLIDENFEMSQSNKVFTELKNFTVKNKILSTDKKADTISQVTKIINIEFPHPDESIYRNLNLTSTPRFCEEIFDKNFKNFFNKISEISSLDNENEGKEEEENSTKSKPTYEEKLNQSGAYFFKDQIPAYSLTKSEECLLRESKKSVFRVDKIFRSRDSGIMSSSGRESGEKCALDTYNQDLTTNSILISEFDSTSYSTSPYSFCYDYQNKLLSKNDSFEKLSKSLPHLSNFSSIEPNNIINKKTNNIKKEIEHLDASEYNLKMANISFEHASKNKSSINKEMIKMYKLLIKIFKFASKRFFYYGNFILFFLVLIFLILLPIILPTCCDHKKEFLIFNEKKYDNNYVPF